MFQNYIFIFLIFRDKRDVVQNEDLESSGVMLLSSLGQSVTMKSG